MARGNEIRYVQFYTDGSAARQLEINPQPKKKSRAPRPKQHKKIVLHVDLIAVAGILVASVMLLLMLSGMAGLNKINAEVTRLEGYLAELESENLQLHQTYRAGYDLDQIREEALAMSMIPATRATTVSLPVAVAEQTESMTGNSFWSFLTGLFA